MNEIADCVKRFASRSVLIMGDFNAKLTLWDSPRIDSKRRITEAWAATLGLSVLNSGTRSTCVWPQGESIVDLTWLPPRSRDW